MRRSASIAVNALVEATPISAPASSMMAMSDSRTSELIGTLQTVAVWANPACFAIRSAARVSAVSPDCESERNRLRGSAVTDR